MIFDKKKKLDIALDENCFVPIPLFIYIYYKLRYLHDSFLVDMIDHKSTRVTTHHQEAIRVGTL